MPNFGIKIKIAILICYITSTLYPYKGILNIHVCQMYALFNLQYCIIFENLVDFLANFELVKVAPYSFLKSGKDTFQTKNVCTFIFL
jgi:hypothetical protein